MNFAFKTLYLSVTESLCQRTRKTFFPFQYVSTFLERSLDLSVTHLHGMRHNFSRDTISSWWTIANLGGLPQWRVFTRRQTPVSNSTEIPERERTSAKRRR